MRNSSPNHANVKVRGFPMRNSGMRNFNAEDAKLTKKFNTLFLCGEKKSMLIRPFAAIRVPTGNSGA
jgi:hypothetical protein